MDTTIGKLSGHASLFWVVAPTYAWVVSISGIGVVSGLARGIDAAAHVGVRSSTGQGSAVAVVGSGPDVHYPKVNAPLWEWVAAHGALISEWPPGIRPAAFRFPLRNRIIAALSEALVVVESRERGGSLITARAALDRGADGRAAAGPHDRGARRVRRRPLRRDADGDLPALAVVYAARSTGRHTEHDVDVCALPRRAPR